MLQQPIVPVRYARQFKGDLPRGIATLVLTLSMALLSICAGKQVHSAENSRVPNIVLILADDLGYGDLGCYGQTQLPTPHLDRMAAEGLRLTRHYAGSTVCAPSRCVLLTGLHTGHCRIRGNGPGTMQDDDVTVAEILRSAGYRTGAVGKWGVGNPPPIDDPARNGFETFYGYVSMFHAHNFYPEFIIRNGQREPLRNVLFEEWQRPDSDGRGVARERVDYVPDLVTAEALEFIRRHRDEPFFLYYAMNVPHANNEAGRTGNGMEVPSYGSYATRDWPEPEKGFASMIRNIDRDVGRLLNLLTQLELAQNTLVIFTSDNGPHQEGRHEMEFFNSNGSLRGMKRDLYEGGVRVPCLAWWPGRIRPNRESDLICGFQDLLPTFAELARAPCPPVDGHSLVPTLLDDGRPQPRHEYLYWEFGERGGAQAVLLENWKGVRLNWAKDPQGRIQLFDLSHDPAEASDVAAEHPEVVARIAVIMEQAHTP